MLGCSHTIQFNVPTPHTCRTVHVLCLVNIRAILPVPREYCPKDMVIHVYSEWTMHYCSKVCTKPTKGQHLLSQYGSKQGHAAYHLKYCKGNIICLTLKGKLAILSRPWFSGLKMQITGTCQSLGCKE